jgi:hypothetical protein
MTTPDLGFVHRYVPVHRVDAPTLLLHTRDRRQRNGPAAAGR